MSYQNGMAALRLEMPGVVPRTEYSAHTHWELVKRVTGIDAAHGTEEERQRASTAFTKAWDYGMYWSILTHNQIFGNNCTKMGHAGYAAENEDFSDDVSQFIEDPEEVFTLDPFEAFGTPDPGTLVAEYNRHYAENNRLWPDCVNMTGIYVTCMSGMLEILGWDTLLMAAGMDLEAFGAFTNRYCGWILQYFEALAKSDAPVVMVHDDITWSEGGFLHPDFYRKYIFGNYKKLFAPLHQAGKLIIYTSDGNYTQFVDDIAACGVNAFVMEPLTDMAYVAEKYGKTHAIIGNADTNVLCFGTRDDIEREVRRCMDIGKGCPGFMMAVGNHIPANTPVENALWYNEFYTRMAKR